MIFDVVVIGGSNWDYVIRGKELPRPGETAEGEYFYEAPGGKGANQAMAAARLGSRVAFISKIGFDIQGDRVLQNLSQEGAGLNYVFRDKDNHTGIALISVNKNGEKQINWAPGANHNLTPDELYKARDIINQTRVVLLQLELPEKTVAAALEIASSCNAKIILDPAPARMLSQELLQVIDLIKPNTQEAEYLTGLKIDNQISARKAAEKLLSMGVKAALVQAGHQGIVLLSKDHYMFLPRIPVKSIDATGAGDALAGALAFGLAKGYSLDQAAIFGNAAAAFKTTLFGAQAGLATYDELITFMADNKIRSQAKF